MQVTHNNHFVPQSYLRRWSDNERRIWCYRILVPHEKVPEWKQQSIQGVAYHRDLYTSLVGGHEIDEFERWLEVEFETPAQSAIERAVHGDVLSSSDWERLIRYLAAQDVRTPQNYIEFIMLVNDQLPKIVKRTVDKTVRNLEEAKRTGRKPRMELATRKQPFADAFKIKIDPHARPETKQGEIRVEVVVNRRLWLESQRSVLENAAQVLIYHCWSIAEAANGFEWITSDQPVACVNYSNKGNYDFKGGWGKEGVDIFMPLSPKHLLFTEIGKELPNRFTLSDRHTYLCQKFMAKQAHRMIFAHKPMPFINQLHARIVDSEMYREEQEALNNWHSNQSKTEQNLDDGI